MGVFEWVVAGLLLCILFAILRVTDHIKQESFWIKDHLKMLTHIKENTFDMNEGINRIKVDVDIISTKIHR